MSNRWTLFSAQKIVFCAVYLDEAFLVIAFFELKNGRTLIYKDHAFYPMQKPITIGSLLMNPTSITQTISSFCAEQGIPYTYSIIVLSDTCLDVDRFYAGPCRANLSDPKSVDASLTEGYWWEMTPLSIAGGNRQLFLVSGLRQEHLLSYRLLALHALRNVVGMFGKSSALMMALETAQRIDLRDSKTVSQLIEGSLRIDTLCTHESISRLFHGSVFVRNDAELVALYSLAGGIIKERKL